MCVCGVDVVWCVLCGVCVGGVGGCCVVCVCGCKLERECVCVGGCANKEYIII